MKKKLKLILLKINIPELKPIKIEDEINKQAKTEEKIPIQVQPVVEPPVNPELKNESVLFKRPEVVVVPNEIKVEEVKNEVKKPIFIKTEEQRIPQPPQLTRKPQPVFDSNPPVAAGELSLENGGQKNRNSKKRRI